MPDLLSSPQTRSILESLPLDESKIYGADRLMCPSYEEWVKYLDKPGPIQSSWIYIHLNRFPIGVRIAEYKTPNGGYEPIGYFQLWHPGRSKVKRYPESHGAADRTDVIHCKKWPRERRELLPEVVLIHLESEEGMGLNWNGRVSAPFRYRRDIKKKRSSFEAIKYLYLRLVRFLRYRLCRCCYRKRSTLRSRLQKLLRSAPLR